MFINISDYPSEEWRSDRVAAAKKIGGPIRDIPFPKVPREATYEEIQQVVDDLILDELSGMALSQVVLVEGERRVQVPLTQKLQERGHLIVTPYLSKGGSLIFRFLEE